MAVLLGPHLRISLKSSTQAVPPNVGRSRMARKKAIAVTVFLNSFIFPFKNLRGESNHCYKSFKFFSLDCSYERTIKKKKNHAFESLEFSLQSILCREEAVSCLSFAQSW